MTQANESLGLTASEHIERIYEHTHAPIFDYALVNTGPFSPETLARYAAEGAAPIVADIERIEALGVRVHRRRLCQRGERRPPHGQPRGRYTAGSGRTGLRIADPRIAKLTRAFYARWKSATEQTYGARQNASRLPKDHHHQRNATSWIPILPGACTLCNIKVVACIKQAVLPVVPIFP